MLSRNLPWLWDWAPFALFWLLLAMLAMAETWRPIHGGRGEPGGRIPGNVGFGLINAVLGVLLPLSTVVPAAWARSEGIGLLNLVPVHPALAALLTVLIRSLATYVVHVGSHKVPLFWRVHRVHHTDVRIDLSTGFRNHPLELAIGVPLFALVSAGLGLDPAVLAVYEAFAIGFALWDHANLDLPDRLDRLLRLVLVTPAMHHIHHSAIRAETDSNYGDVLSLWDRLFGTYRESDLAALRAMRIGLGPGFDEGASNIAHQLALPLAPTPAEAEAQR